MSFKLTDEYKLKVIKANDDTPIERLVCPKCGNYGSFTIGVGHTANITKEGIFSTAGCEEWNEDSYCFCDDCEYEGIVDDFQIGYYEAERLKAEAEGWVTK